MKFAPIIIFSYNRPKHLKKTLCYLKKNILSKKSEIFFFSDGPKSKNKKDLKKINSVKKIIKNTNGFKKKNFIFHKKNIGLKKNILGGVSHVLKKYPHAIVLEDDIIVGKYFLDYMNQGLNFYKNKKKIWHISGWNYDFKIYGTDFQNYNTFFTKNMNCWGWATWKNRWKRIITDPDFFIKKMNNKKIYDFNFSNSLNNWSQLMRNKKNKLNTWAIFWNATIFYHNGLCLNPVKSLVKNIGFDGSGENSFPQQDDKSKISNTKNFLFSKKLKENFDLRDKIIFHMKQRNKKEKWNYIKKKILSIFD